MKKLHQLISEKESELQNLEDSLGLGFPIVEQAKMTQISHLRLELEDLRQIEKSIQLNDNQKIVLEWLKEEKEERCSFESAIYWYFEDDVEPDIISDRLTQLEFLQVLAAFADWGMKEEEE
ncbi:hypothetical protein [Enterococcus avium]|uniref:hypothetical protein n=1 Tax=Enterococcus avium TaxID=33945 RepID=UPI003D0C2FA5